MAPRQVTHDRPTRLHSPSRAASRKEMPRQHTPAGRIGILWIIARS